MRLHILSDFYLEFADYSIQTKDYDALIVAGDLPLGMQGLDFLKRALILSPVIYVLGNHEFYGYEYQSLLKQWLSVKLPGLHLLENGIVVLNDICFMGCTLWTNIVKETTEAQKMIESGMTDYYIIKHNGRKLTTADTSSVHLASLF